jgi:molybdopterin-guanine dinucleotide biosynthesis protein A
VVIDGLLLAGGRSRRFGADKRLALFDGQALARTACQKLSQVIDGTVFAATGARRDTLPGLECAILLVDEVHERGPLGGIAAGLRRARSGVLVLACDLPLVRVRTLERLIRVARNTNRAVALRGPRGWEPLVAWYPVAALETIRTVLKSSRPAPFLVLERLGAAALPVHDATELANVNTPADLAEAEAWAGGTSND